MSFDNGTTLGLRGMSLAGRGGLADHEQAMIQQREHEQAFARRMAREKALELACGTYGNAPAGTIVAAAEEFRKFIAGEGNGG